MLFCAEIPFLLPFQLLLQDKTEKLVYIWQYLNLGCYRCSSYFRIYPPGKLLWIIWGPGEWTKGNNKKLNFTEYPHASPPTPTPLIIVKKKVEIIVIYYWFRLIRKSGLISLSAVRPLAELKLVCSAALFPRPLRTSTSWPWSPRARDIRDPSSTESSRTSCSRVEISPGEMELEEG